MKRLRISRRNFLRIAVYSTPALCLADTFLIEPEWIAVRRISLSPDPAIRLAHFTDLHYKGDRGYLNKVVERINGYSPDIVCFTGDIVEDSAYLDEALDCLARIQPPMYGVPGNWDYLSQAPTKPIAECFESTGGAWLKNTTEEYKGCQIVGMDNREPDASDEADIGKRILLTHYPTDADLLPDRYDIVLAGHSHGGQCRLPFYGSLIVPDLVGPYDRGLFETKGGPLYVNPGIGTFQLPVRFLCRPEITLIEV